MRFYVTEKLGQKLGLTPEGFLLCRDVPIARTGTQIYGPGETPLDDGPDGIVKVEREEDEVFAPSTVASFAGKPVVDEHPEVNGERVDVTPQNWRDFARGVVLDPRRGTGAMDDCLIGDLLITDLVLIDLIRTGAKREVSCGYDADYVALEPGHGRQRNIIGNHVALVDQGRCGPRCSIGDQLPKGEATMTKLTCDDAKKVVMDKARAAFKARDEKALDAALGELAQNEGEEKKPVFNDEELGKRFEGFGKRLDAVDAGLAGIHKYLKSKDAAFGGEETEEEEREEHGEQALPEGDATDAAVAKEMQMEASPGISDSAIKKARDSAFMAESFSDTVAIAEILAPGIKVPVFDRSAAPKKTFDAICQFRRRALDAAYHDNETREIIDEILAGRTLDTKKMSCSDARNLFRAAGLMKRRVNNDSGFHVGEKTAVNGTGGGLGVAGAIKTPADLNARNREHWKRSA